jgi:predicted porin
MKKSLIALAVMAAAGAASAQSSVTLFGIVDVNYNYIKGDGNGHVSRLTDSGYNSSRLGFRGTEDLGGGMSASFWLEAGLNPDNGTGDATNTNNQVSGTALTGVGGAQGVTFNRRSTVSLAGGWGELRLGRDYVPTFWNLTVFDPFGTNGVGAYTNLAISAGTGVGGQSALLTSTRASNSIGYFLPPNLGGFYGQFMYAMGENASNVAAGKDDGRYIGGRLGFASGPFNVAVAYGQTKFTVGGAAVNGVSPVGADYRVANIGGQWDFGFGKLLAQWGRDEIRSPVHPKQDTYLIGGLIPVGAGEIRLAWAHANVKTPISAAVDDADQFAVGYVHNLSKRTAVYATYARVNNKGQGIAFSNGRATTELGGSTDGFDLGIRHSF